MRQKRSIAQCNQGRDRVIRRQQAHDLARHPFRRQRAKQVLVAGTRGQTVRVQRVKAQLRMETEESQDAQNVLLNACVRITDKAQALGDDVVISLMIIRKISLLIRIQRIDGKIPTQRVFPPICGIGDDGPPAIGFNIPPQAGDLNRSVW